MIPLLDIVGQDAAVVRMQKAMAQGRLPHAMLFAGPAGVGRRTTATALAAALLCEKPLARPNEKRFAELPADFPLRDACGTCADCRMMASLSHPDFELVYKELAAFHSDASVRDRKMQEISIDVIRDFLIKIANRASTRGRGKVFVVKEADLLGEEAQNALLKTLEEPPPGVTILLLAEHPDDLLPTTLSRCSVMRFVPLPADFVRSSLTKAGVAPDEAAFWTSLTGGSLGEALRYSAQGLYGLKLETLRKIAALSPAGDADLADELAKTMDSLAETVVSDARKATGVELSKLLGSRIVAGTMLRLIASAFSDAMRLSCAQARGEAEPALVNADQPQSIRGIASRMDVRELADVLEQLGEYERLLWRNVSPRLLWDNIIITCASAAPLRV
jgi:DNA polymerase-3 subunit delta'